MSSTVVFTINSTTTLDVTGNDFSNRHDAQGPRRHRRSQAATINLAGNYWGSTVIATIDGEDRRPSTNATCPLSSFSPLSTVPAARRRPRLGDVQPDESDFQPHRDREHHAGVAINEGTETFTILNGTQTSARPRPPAGGKRIGHGQLYAPAGTPAGQYIIEANYSGSDNYLPSTDSDPLSDRRSRAGPPRPSAVLRRLSAPPRTRSITFSAQVAARPALSTKGS